MKIEKLLNQSITLSKKVQDYTGSWTTSVASTEAAHVEYGRKTVVGKDGGDIAATAIVFLSETAQFDVTHNDWEITHNGRTYKVISIDPIYDPRVGLHHYEIGIL